MNEVTNVESLISMNKRLQIEIGIENSGNQFKEEEMFWIPFGVFVIQNASVTYNNQGIQISLKLTDKMALLNGELGGTFTQAITHSPMGEYADGGQTIVDKGVKVRTLIEYLLRDYGELEEYEYSIENVPNTIKNIIRWGNGQKVLKIKEGDSVEIVNDPRPEGKGEFPDNGFEYYGIGDNIGYMETDFVYPLDKTLDSKPGETVTSVLDKIKNTLGNYEYFFDISGIFRFREIPNFLNAGSTIDDLTQAIAEKYFINVDTSAGRSVYRFNDATLISSYANNPQYNQIKNDYSVWGKTSQTEQDIWYHLLIAEAPDDYSTQVWKVYFTENPEDPGFYDIKTAKPIDASTYTGVKFFEWQENSNTEVEWNGTEFTPAKIGIVNFISPNRPTPDTMGSARSKDDDWRLKFYLQALEKIPSKRTPFDKEVIEKMPILYKLEHFAEEDEDAFFMPIYDRNDLPYWLDIVNTNDYKLTQALEFKQFGIESIGRKVKTITDNDVNCLFYSTENAAPKRLFVENTEAGASGVSSFINENGEQVYSVPTSWGEIEEAQKNDKDEIIKEVINFWNGGVALGTVENPAYDLLRSSLHEHLSYNNSINLTAMPVYHLDANDRISVYNKESAIYGDYIINSLTIPLGLDGMMTINARKTVERI